MKRTKIKPASIVDAKPRNQNDTIFTKLFEQNKKITELLKRKGEVPYIWEGNRQILTGTIFKGVLLNSINSTNLASPVLVKAYPNQGLPFGSKFICFGTTAHKRVQTVCNKLVSHDGEVRINAKVLNLDGSSGLLGFYDDGKEDLITGANISEFTQGLLSASKSRIVTGIGEIEETSFKK